MKKYMINIRLDPDTAEMLREEAYRSRQTKTALVRQAVIEYIHRRVKERKEATR